MFKKLWNKLFPRKKPAPTIEFRATYAPVHIGTPVQEARKVIPYWAKNQLENKEYRFAKCPGMFDMAQMGYIIPAWTDIHIKANKQGVVIRLLRETPGLRVVKMDLSVVDGLAKVDGIKKQVWKIEMPWSIFCKPGYSAQVLPAVMHSAFLDKVHVYSGIVDYDSYHTINFIITVLEECEFTIWAGEPLLQIIPFKREDITAECGKGTSEHLEKAQYCFYSRAPNFFRKELHSRKSYKMEIEK